MSEEKKTINDNEEVKIEDVTNENMVNNEEVLEDVKL